ncbi:MAG: dihydrodipicolinate synthase family protein, partial [Thermomicrobiales bacterium]|nr:dihydrodipicolinate synthase family protein [Thermomicrobiales bacterium]
MAEGLKPGVHCISATPFQPDESLDLASVRTLLDYLIAGGCDGALFLGVLGEADRLSDHERQQVLETALDHAGDRLQISVGITHNSTVVSRQRALDAQKQGVAAVMVSPPPGSAAGPALAAHFERIAADLTIPLIVQDHPTSSGVK